MAAVTASRFRAMGTDAHVLVVAPAEEAERLVTLATSTIEMLESRWSRFRPDSDISRINRHPGRPVRVSGDTIEAVGLAVDAWHRTGGTFDPTIGSALISAGYDRPFDQVQAMGTHLEAVGHTPQAAPGPQGIEVHPIASTVTVPDGVMLDLGGVGKGLAADRTVAAVLAAGATGVLVNLGGDLRADGVPPSDLGWHVDLECPGSNERLQCRIRRGAICTSSSTRRTWQTSAGRQHHLLDPRTGRPHHTGVVSATVIGASAAACEVLATSAIASGLGGGPDLIRANRATGVLIDESGAIHQLDGFEQFEAGRDR